MKLFRWGKDGGPESHVYGLFFEIKSLFTVALLRFDDGTRQAYHNHAFDAVSWLLSGYLEERFLDERNAIVHEPRLKPIVTKKEDFHQVESYGRSWVLTFRGPWNKTWKEYTHHRGEYTLSNGRIEI